MANKLGLTWFWWARLGLSLALLAVAPAACIKARAPGVAGGDTQAGPAPVAPAPTGKYGEVAGVSLLPAGGISAFQLDGQVSKVNLTTVPVQGQPFEQALRAEIKESSKNNWDVQLQAKTVAAVEAGDVMLATFYFRTEKSRRESAEGQSQVVFEIAQPPWTKSVEQSLEGAGEWRKIHARFSAAGSYPAGGARLIFRLGFEPQTIEIGGVTLQSFGKQLALESLPVTELSYRGREPEAAWRSAAAERIEKIRKGELRITVKDRAGRPAAGVKLAVRQTRQAFGFGSAVVAGTLTRPGSEEYKKNLVELFNYAVLENDLKWQPLAGDWGSGYSLERARAGVDWLRAKGLNVRGHVLVWPSFRNLPRSLKAQQDQPAKLRAQVNAHVTELATAMQGKLVHWDVLNEPFDNHDLMDLLGQDEMVTWFKLAREADPAAKLFINDYGILSGGGGETGHRAAYEQTIRFLLEKAAPVDGIGMQGHFGTSLTAPEDMLAILDRFGRFKKPIWVTEYDVVMPDEKLAADFTRDFYTVLFSHPSVHGALMWGFWDGAHWKSNAPLFRRDWSLKPAGEVFRDLVLSQWRTNASLVSDAQGLAGTRAFLGDYEITLTAGGKQQVAKVSVTSPAINAFAVTLD